MNNSRSKYKLAKFIQDVENGDIIVSSYNNNNFHNYVRDLHDNPSEFDSDLIKVLKSYLKFANEGKLYVSKSYITLNTPTYYRNLSLSLEK